MKPFNLDRMIAGDPVICRDGEIPYDFYYVVKDRGIYPIKCTIVASLVEFTKDGKYFDYNKCYILYHDGSESGYDLFMKEDSDIEGKYNELTKET